MIQLTLQYKVKEITYLKTGEVARRAGFTKVWVHQLREMIGMEVRKVGPQKQLAWTEEQAAQIAMLKKGPLKVPVRKE